MLTQINGLHHVTSIGSDARAIDDFWSRRLGLRRVKKTVNFDAPDVYHLYYGDDLGRPGTAMTFFPFPGAAKGRRGTGEADEVRLSIPRNAATFWAERLDATVGESVFGDCVVETTGPDGDRILLVEDDDPRPSSTRVVDAEHAIRGFHSVSLSLADIERTAELLRFMGYKSSETAGNTHRFVREGGTANTIDLVERPATPRASEGAGSVHHVAFSVPTRSDQSAVRDALSNAGFAVTPPIDRDYFWAIYFRTPGGVLFEVATDEPGFDRDEDRDELGQALKLPAQHAHLRDVLERRLTPLD